jgi:hypothetical protein
MIIRHDITAETYDPLPFSSADSTFVGPRPQQAFS